MKPSLHLNRYVSNLLPNFQKLLYIIHAATALHRDAVQIVADADADGESEEHDADNVNVLALNDIQRQYQTKEAAVRALQQLDPGAKQTGNYTTLTKRLCKLLCVC